MSSTTKIANGISVNGRLKKQDTFQSNSSTTINLSKSDSNYHSPFQSRMYHKSNVRTSKLFRILTVLAYIIAVSMAAILLSLYYTFIWNPNYHRDNKSKELTHINRQHLTTAKNIEPSTSRSSNQTHSFIHEQNDEINSRKSRPIASLMMVNHTTTTTNVRQ